MVYLLQMVIFHGYVSHNQRLLALSTVVFRLFQRILPVGIWCPFDLGKTSMSPSNMPEIGVYKHFAHPVCAHSLLKTFEAGKSACMPAFAARTHTHVCKFAAWKGHTFPTFSTMDYLGSLKLKPPCFNAWLPTFPPLANTLGLWSKSFYSSILKKNQVALLLCPQFMPRTITS